MLGTKVLDISETGMLLAAEGDPGDLHELVLVHLFDGASEVALQAEIARVLVVGPPCGATACGDEEGRAPGIESGLTPAEPATLPSKVCTPGLRCDEKGRAWRLRGVTMPKLADLAIRHFRFATPKIVAVVVMMVGTARLASSSWSPSARGRTGGSSQRAPASSRR